MNTFNVFTSVAEREANFRVFQEYMKQVDLYQRQWNLWRKRQGPFHKLDEPAPVLPAEPKCIAYLLHPTVSQPVAAKPVVADSSVPMPRDDPKAQKEDVEDIPELQYNLCASEVFVPMSRDDPKAQKEDVEDVPELQYKTCASEVLGENGSRALNSGEGLVGGGRRRMKRRGRPFKARGRGRAGPSISRDFRIRSVPADKALPDSMIADFKIALPIQTQATAVPSGTVAGVTLNMNSMKDILTGTAIAAIPYYAGLSSNYLQGRVERSSIKVPIMSQLTAGTFTFVLFPSNTTAIPGTAAQFATAKDLPGAVTGELGLNSGGNSSLVLRSSWNVADFVAKVNGVNMYETQDEYAYTVGVDPTTLFYWVLIWLQTTPINPSAGTFTYEPSLRNKVTLFGRETGGFL